jgi:hypothetical protein
VHNTRGCFVVRSIRQHVKRWRITPTFGCTNHLALLLLLPPLHCRLVNDQTKGRFMVRSIRQHMSVLEPLPTLVCTITNVIFTSLALLRCRLVYDTKGRFVMNPITQRMFM